MHCSHAPVLDLIACQEPFAVNKLFRRADKTSDDEKPLLFSSAAVDVPSFSLGRLALLSDCC